MPVCHRQELRVYDRTGSGSYTVLPATGVSWSKELGGGGFLSATFDARLPALMANPHLLDDCVIKVAVATDVAVAVSAAPALAAYAVRAREGTLLGEAGAAFRTVNAAPTLWTAWAQDARLYPESNVLAQMSSEQRYFSPASILYDPTADPDYTWGTPSDSAGQQDSTSGDRAGNPDGWPTELGNAYWITRPSGTDAELSRHLFVTDVVVPSDCYLTVYMSADESTAWYWGAELINQSSSSETGYQVVDTWSAWVYAGTYRLMADKTSIVSRGGDGVDPILCGVATNHDNGSIDDILLVTNDSDWLCYPMHPVTGITPSLTPGAIMLELHAQAAARGVDTWAAITPDFTATSDSASDPWGHREERTWRIGYESYLDMIEGLGDLGVDVDVTPDLTLTARGGDGADLSGSVVVIGGVHTSDVREAGSAVEATHLLVQTQDGWVEVENPIAIARYGRRESSLSLGNAPSIAQGRQLGQKVLDERLSRQTTERPVVMTAQPDLIPLVHFGLGDRIGAPGGPGWVLSIAASAASTESIVTWTLKLGEDTDDE